MTQTISSAQPASMQRFANLLDTQGNAVAAEGRRLASALDRLTATCREYSLGNIGSLGDRVQSLGRRDAELAGWVRGVAEAFLAADSTSAPPSSLAACAPVAAPGPISTAARWVFAASDTINRWQTQVVQGTQFVAHGGQIILDISVSIADSAAWNMAAQQLLESLQFLNASAQISGNHTWGVVAGGLQDIRSLGSSLLTIGGLIILESRPQWESAPIDDPGDQLNILEQRFWDLAFHKVSPDLLLALAVEIEELKRRTCADMGGCANPRPPKFAEDNLTLEQAFPDAIPDPVSGELTLPPWTLMYGNNSAISPYQDEQLSYQQIGEHEHLFAICGLDLENMANSPNGLVAVIQTATDADPMQNAYYRLIKERFLSYLAEIPPGDTLDITGHSMGGGMTMLLLNDPEIQAALLAGGYTLHSVTLYGAVRPMDVRFNGVPPSTPSELAPTLFTGTEVRFYIDPEDRLAMNVGAGHLTSDGLPMPNVHFIDDSDLSGGVEAHTSYGQKKKYDDLPADLQTLPFHVDPRYWKHTRFPPSIDLNQDEDMAPTPVPGPTPAPTPTPTPTPTPHP